MLCGCSTDISEAEALGVSNIFRKLLLFFPPSVLVALPEEMLRQLVDNLTALTCKFAQGAAHEEMVSFLICLPFSVKSQFPGFLEPQWLAYCVWHNNSNLKNDVKKESFV